MGAGPSGLLLSLLLSSCTPPIRSTIVERRTQVDDNPRASFYASPVLREFRRVPGLMERVLERSFVPDAVAWRHLDGREICRIEPPNDAEGERRGEGRDGKAGGVTMVSLPLDGLLPIMVELLKGIADEEAGVGRLLLGREVVAVGQDRDQERAWVDVKAEGSEAVERMEGHYVIGCDGANSTVRKALFGDSWPGFTWDKQIVATNVRPRTERARVQRQPLTSCEQVYYPRFESFKWTSSSFMLDPAHFSMIAQIAPDGLLRITYGEEGNLTREQMQERLPWKFKQFVPGAPEPSEYSVVNFSPYKIHQRCAESLRVGRILLAADSAHVCNPL